MLFVVYVWRLTRLPAEEPRLVGPARLIGALPTGRRRAVTAVLAVAVTATILLVAKPFAQALVATGTQLGIDEFLLVQWLAPLTSEAPEFVVVLIFAWGAAATATLGTLVSAKINQWTLLVALGAPEPLPLYERQRRCSPTSPSSAPSATSSWRRWWASPL